MDETHVGIRGREPDQLQRMEIRGKRKKKRADMYRCQWQYGGWRGKTGPPVFSGFKLG